MLNSPRQRAATLITLLALGVTTSAAWSQNAALVNGKAISKAKLDEFVSALAQEGRPDTPELRNAVRDELIARELFMQEAERRGLPRAAAVKNMLESARQDILIRALVRDELKKQAVTDPEIQAEYDKIVQAGGDKEYRARHILVATESEAKTIIEQLRHGAKFEELAKQSKDLGSAAQGGDLDWSAPGAYVKPFADALASLNKGDVTPAPVQTEFGFHIIRLDDVRATQAPPLSQVMAQLKQQLERQRIQDLQQNLRKKALIQ